MHDLREKELATLHNAPSFDKVWKLKQEEKDNEFSVIRLGDGEYRVAGARVERMVIQTDWDNEEAMSFLQHRLKRIGVEKALEQAGAVDGDTIRICGREFEFESAKMSHDIFEELDI